MAGFVVPLITAGISGLAGLFGNKSQVTKTSQTSNNSSSTNPNLSGLQQSLLNTAGMGALKQFNSGPADLTGYTDNALQTINSGSRARQLAISNILRQRGQSFSPAASFVQSQGEGDRINQQDQVLQSIPLLQRQLHDQDLQQLMSSIGPYGSSSTGSSSSSGTQTGPANKTGGLLGGLGQGLFAPSSPGGGSNLSSILSALGIGSGGGGQQYDNSSDY